MTKEDQIKEVIRLSKLHQINGKVIIPSLKPLKGFFRKSKLLKVMEQINDPNFIFTGSVALKCYGLSIREPKDIDIILIEEDSKYKSANNRYGDDKLVYGYEYKHNYNIDYFLNEGEKPWWVEVDGFKIHNIFQLMRCKGGLNRDKDYNDLLIISDKLKLY